MDVSFRDGRGRRGAPTVVAAPAVLPPPVLVAYFSPASATQPSAAVPPPRVWQRAAAGYLASGRRGAAARPACPQRSEDTAFRLTDACRLLFSLRCSQGRQYILRSPLSGSCSWGGVTSHETQLFVLQEGGRGGGARTASCRAHRWPPPPLPCHGLHSGWHGGSRVCELLNRQGGSTRSHWTGPSLDSSEAPATLPLLAVPVPRCAQYISPLWVEGAAAPGGRARFVPGLVAVEVELPHGRCTLVVWSPRIPVRSPIGGFRPRTWRHSLL